MSWYGGVSNDINGLSLSIRYIMGLALSNVLMITVGCAISRGGGGLASGVCIALHLPSIKITKNKNPSLFRHA